MNELILAQRCASCDEAITDDDRFCRRCGGPVASSSAAISIRRNGPVVPAYPARSLLESRAAVVGLLVVVGPLGLPFLWLSRRFSRPTKIITTIAYFGLTIVAPIAVTWYWLDTAIRPLLDVWERKP